jgi:hypothetical protein
MRVEPYTIGNFVHVYNQGNRKQLIVLDERDWWRFLLMLRYFNDEYSPHNFSKELKQWRGNKQDLKEKERGRPALPQQGRAGLPCLTQNSRSFQELIDWPPGWPAHDPLVNIVCFVLMKNHYHLILEEIKEGGIARFMHKLATGMTMYFNAKYEESGRLFRGPYKSKTIEKDEYLSYLSVYIQVKNPFERYAGGLEKAIKEFDQAFEWALKDPYSSLSDYAGSRNSPIITKNVLGEMFSSPEEYREFAKQCILGMNLEQKIDHLAID